MALWQTGHYEARMLATFVDEPELVSAALNPACIELAERLASRIEGRAGSGKDALRELTSAGVQKRLSARISET